MTLSSGTHIFQVSAARKKVKEGHVLAQNALVQKWLIGQNKSHNVHTMSAECGEIQTFGKAVFVVIISAIILHVLFSSLKMY